MQSVLPSQRLAGLDMLLRVLKVQDYTKFTQSEAVSYLIINLKLACMIPLLIDGNSRSVRVSTINLIKLLF